MSNQQKHVLAITPDQMLLGDHWKTPLYPLRLRFLVRFYFPLLFLPQCLYLSIYLFICIPIFLPHTLSRSLLPIFLCPFPSSCLWYSVLSQNLFLYIGIKISINLFIYASSICLSISTYISFKLSMSVHPYECLIVLFPFLSPNATLSRAELSRTRYWPVYLPTQLALACPSALGRTDRSQRRQEGSALLSAGAARAGDVTAQNVAHRAGRWVWRHSGSVTSQHRMWLTALAGGCDVI